MNRLGYAHSIECWDHDNLIGGLYGVHIGSCFFGESMFKKITNGSKLSLLFLVTILIKKKFTLLDAQFYNQHLLQFGAYEIPDNEYQSKLKIALKKECLFPKKMNYLDSVSILQSLTQTS